MKKLTWEEQKEISGGFAWLPAVLGIGILVNALTQTAVSSYKQITSSSGAIEFSEQMGGGKTAWETNADNPSVKQTTSNPLIYVF